MRSRIIVAKQLIKIAKQLMAAPWVPVRDDIDVGMRNKEAIQSLTSFAPRLSAIVRQEAVKKLQRQDFRVNPNDLTRVESKYLAFIDPKINANKYHYYVIYSFADDMGVERYIALNCSGRIGIVERIFDLTSNFIGGAVTDLYKAEAAIDKHMRTKLAKGYQPMPMIRG